MHQLKDFITKPKNLIEGVLLRDEIPVTELPPCRLTGLLDSKDKEMRDFADQLKRQQVKACYNSMLSTLPLCEKISLLQYQEGSV